MKTAIAMREDKPMQEKPYCHNGGTKMNGGVDDATNGNV